MASTYNTIANEVLSRLGGRTDLTSRLAIWINDAIAELALSPRFSFTELDTVNSFNTASGTQSYSLTAFTSFWFVLDITDTTNSRRIKQMSYKDLDAKVVTTGQPTRYARFGSTILFDPTPDGTYATQVRYRMRPTQVSGGLSMPFEREWDEVITLLATIKGLEALDARDKAGLQRQLLEPLLSLREDVPLLEDRDGDYGLKPVLEGRVY